MERRDMIPVTIQHLAMVEKVGFVVLLKSRMDERSLPIIIGVPEAQSILIALNKMDIPRPLTHDLMKNLLDLFDGRLVSVEICDLQENTYYAQLVIEKDTRRVELDCRPSDAIALALRTNVAIWVNPEVMERAGRIIKPEELAAEAPGRKAAPKKKGGVEKEDALTRLTRQLDQAVQEERYEDAARIRDEMARHKGNASKN
jgi:bifunctional DNase/RNase